MSAPAWRLYIALCFQWDRIARRGLTPHLTRPVLVRDGGGNMLDADGSILKDQKGRPQRDGAHPRAVETGAREANPAGEALHHVYDTPRDLARLVWPLGGGRLRKNRCEAEEQAIKAARWLAGETDAAGLPIRLYRQAIAAPAVQIVRLGERTAGNPDGFPWRIVPPWTR